MRCWKFELLCVYASASLGHASPHYVFGKAEGCLVAPRSYLEFSGLLWGGVRVPRLCVRHGRGVVESAEVIFRVLGALQVRMLRATEPEGSTLQPRKTADTPENVAQRGR